MSAYLCSKGVSSVMQRSTTWSSFAPATLQSQVRHAPRVAPQGPPFLRLQRRASARRQRAQASAELDQALEHALGVAREVEARCLVLATPPSVTPTELNRKRLKALVERIPHDAVSLAWEPRGLWETEEAVAIADDLRYPCSSSMRREKTAPKGPIAYFRLRGLGESTRLSPAAIDKVAAELSARREAYVVIESASPATVAQALRKKVGRRAAGGRGTGIVLKPRATFQAEDEEQ